MRAAIKLITNITLHSLPIIALIISPHLQKASSIIRQHSSSFSLKQRRVIVETQLEAIYISAIKNGARASRIADRDRVTCTNCPRRRWDATLRPLSTTHKDCQLSKDNTPYCFPAARLSNMAAAL